ncbi:glycosyltransferase family 2 protein [Vibrio cyclitrophicus]
MTNNKIAVVTPVFNGESHIRQCYRCLQQQTYQHFEWVIINDGSSDSTQAIVEQIMKNHPIESFQITLINQDNQGAAKARENGIKTSTATYILTLDCDDIISVDTIKNAIYKMESTPDYVEIVTFPLCYVKKSGRKVEFEFKVDSWPVEGTKAFALCLGYWGLHGMFLAKKNLWIEAFEYFDDISDDNINDDENVTRCLFLLSKYIEICDGEYLYCFNESSTTNSVNQKYYKLCYTAISLSKMVSGFGFRKSDIGELLNLHLKVNLLKVSKRFLRYFFHYKNKLEWLKAIMLLLVYIFKIRLLKW